MFYCGIRAVILQQVLLKTTKMLKYLLFLVINLITSYVSIDAKITIERNGYSNIVVAVSPDIPNDNAAQIIQNIQVVFIFFNF